MRGKIFGSRCLFLAEKQFSSGSPGQHAKMVKIGSSNKSMSNEKFDHAIQFGDFLEWQWVHGNKYGTPISPLEDALDDSHTMLLDIDVKGGISVMEEFPNETIGIFIEPPGDDLPEQLEILEERLNQRGNEPPQLIVKRLKRFPLEIEYKEKFKFHFVNEDLEKTIKDTEKVIKEELM